MPRIILLSVFALFVTLPASAQQNAEPCGPAADLSEDFSKNVDAGSRCFELRMYTAEPAVNGEGGIDNLHQRFREEEVAIFEKHVPRLSLSGSVWTIRTRWSGCSPIEIGPTARKFGKRLPRSPPGMRCGKNTRYRCRQKLT